MCPYSVFPGIHYPHPRRYYFACFVFAFCLSCFPACVWWFCVFAFFGFVVCFFFWFGLCRLQLQSNLFASLDETLLARAEALAAVDIAVSQGKSHPFKPDATYHTMNSVPCTSTSTVPLAHHHHHHLHIPDRKSTRLNSSH